MGFLSKLFGLEKKNNPEVKSEVIQEAKQERMPEIGIKSLSKAQYEFLIRLQRQPVDTRMFDIWAPIVGNCENTTTRFIKEGFLEEASVAEKFDKKYRVVDLKPFLEQYNMKKKGKKAETIEALLAVMPPSEATNAVNDLRLYSFTPMGQQSIDDYLREKKKAKNAMESEATSYLIRGDIKAAGKRISQYESEQLFPRGIGIDWSHGMPESSLMGARYLLNYPYQDLDVSDGQRKEIGTRLALSNLLGEHVSDAGKRLLDVTNGTLPCAPLVEFLRNSPCGGYASNMDPDKPENLAELYAHTRLFEASSLREIASLKASKVGKGIEILPVGNDQCSICNGGKLKYRWSDVSKMPMLPRHWGCRCTYVGWID